MMSKYEGDLFCAPRTGHVFEISGKTVDGARRLEFNFMCGKQPDADIPLHISVRFDKDTIARNSRLNGKWGAEECEPKRIDFSAGDPCLEGVHFKVYILCSSNAFHIAINDYAYCLYEYRTPMQYIRSVQVAADLQSIVQMDHRCLYPVPLPIAPLPELTSERLEFSNDCPGRFTAGHVIVLSAIPYGNGRGFFALRFAECSERNLALHFVVRFDLSVVVVRIAPPSFATSGFSDAEADNRFPFDNDEKFKLAVAFGQSEFKFAVNGKLFSTLAYRGVDQLQRMDGMRIVAGRGLHMEVIGVNHIRMDDSSLEDFEAISQPDCE